MFPICHNLTDQEFALYGIINHGFYILALVTVIAHALKFSFAYTDIDECDEDHGCHHLCNNTDGSFHCYCDPGYMLHSNGTTCIG